MTNLAASAGFDEWTQGRALRSIGTNHGATPLAFQHWHKFKEAFAPEIVHAAVERSGIPVETVLDPFGGSGTTALASQFLGRHPVTSEVNPYLADVIEAKLQTYDAAELRADLRSVIEAVSGSQSEKPYTGWGRLPPSFVEPGVDGRWIFSREVFAVIGCALAAIDNLGSVSNRRLFRAVLGGCLVGVSNVIISGKGRRYRRNWQARQIQRREAEGLIVGAWTGAVEDALRLAGRASKTYDLRRGSSLKPGLQFGDFELAVFSPPYANSFDYTDVYNLELWVLGYLRSALDNRELRLATMSSHVQVHREYVGHASGVPVLDNLVEQLVAIRGSLWNKNIPEMVSQYFAEMRVLLRSLYADCAARGQIWIVIGDSQYNGTVVPIAEILAELARVEGFEVVERSVLRLMNAAPQQGGQKAIPESLVVLHKSR